MGHKRSRHDNDAVFHPVNSRQNTRIHLSDIMQARLDNDAFLCNLLGDLSVVNDIAQSKKGVYGALNQSNRFWYLVVFRASQGRVHAWDARFNYKIPALQMLRNHG